MSARESSGGEAMVGRLLRQLGFTVQVGEELIADRLERLLARLQVARVFARQTSFRPHLAALTSA